MTPIAMPASIDYVHNYRKVDGHSMPISIWSFAVIIFGTCVLILILIFMYKKCFYEKVNVYFGDVVLYSFLETMTKKQLILLHHLERIASV